MVPRDLRLKRDADRIVPNSSDVTTSFGPVGNDPALATVSTGPTSVSFGVDGAAAVPAVTAPDGASVTYNNIRPYANLELAASADGVKEKIVLASPDAPLTWSFPLSLTGLTPTLDSASGAVIFKDAAGKEQARIPAGWMQDSKVNPNTGDAAMSYEVKYALAQRDGRWVLDVSLDSTWLHDPARQFPVIVDPPVRVNADADDTYVQSPYNADHSNESEVKVGHYTDGSGGHNAAAYIDFNTILPTIRNKYVVAADVFLTETWSYSCRASAITMFPVTKPWAGSTMKTWPGVAYDTRYGVTKSFAHGYSSSACPAARERFPVNADLMTKWAHGKTAVYGFTFRASTTDNNTWKKFASAQSPVSANIPYLDVTYQPEGASYEIRDPVFNPPVTNTQSGDLNVVVYNWGQSTWPAGGAFKLTYRVLRGSTVVVGPGTYRFSPPVAVLPANYGIFKITVPPLPPAKYDLEVDMGNSTGQFYSSTYTVPPGRVPFSVGNVAPAVTANQPASGATATSLTPTLYAESEDPDRSPPNNAPKYSFKICGGDPDAPVGCAASGWQLPPTWTPPANILRWGKKYFWTVQATDQVTDGPISEPIWLTTQPAQPEITSHLSSNGDSRGAPGLDVQIGNYTTQAVDASVEVPGPPLSIVRSYNSSDPRTSGAFGPGWSSLLDTGLRSDTDGSGNVVVTNADGRETRFGRNPDGTYAPPEGRNATLVFNGTDSEYTLTDPSGQRTIFDSAGHVLSIQDNSGHAQTWTYDSNGKLSTITDTMSHRALHFVWANGRVASIATDPVNPNAPPLKWTYEYTDGALTKTCTPLSATSCTTYDYQSGTRYRSMVLDDNPYAYWRLGEDSEAEAGNSLVARKLGADQVAYDNVRLGESGATGGADTAAGFDAGGFDPTGLGGNGPSTATLPDKLASPAVGLAAELWFKTTGSGVLLGQQNTALNDTPSRFVPVLYVGTDGKLRGQWWQGAINPITSSSAVNDDQWHHAVISGAINMQTLYLDGVAQGTLPGLIAHEDIAKTFLGTTRTSYWPSAVDGYNPFTGSIDDFALYWHPLGATAVTSHYASRTPISTLKSVDLPGHRDASVEYGATTERVTALTDSNGGKWTLDDPVTDTPTSINSIEAPTPQRSVTLHSDTRSDITSIFDVDHSGRLIKRVDGDGATSWTYNEAGFVDRMTNENNHSVVRETDDRGNTLSRTTCQNSGGDNPWCSTSYYKYYLNASDPLDPRNDKLTSSCDARSYNEEDENFCTTYTYDANGRPLTVTEPTFGEGGTVHPVTKYAYGTDPTAGSYGQLTTITGKRNQQTQFTYKTSGDVDYMTDPLGLVTQYGYDSLGRVVSTNRLDAEHDYGTTAYTYTGLSNVKTVTDPPVKNPLTGVTHRQRSTYTYGDDGQVTRRVASDLTTGSDTERIWTYSYDGHGRLETATSPGDSVEKTGYDSAGDPTSTVTETGLQLTNTYNDRHQLLTRTADGSNIDPQDPSATSLVLEARSYDPAGRLATRTDAMGVTRVYTYWDNDLLRSDTLKGYTQGGTKPAKDLDMARYWYDDAGNLWLAEGPGAHSTSYGFDNAGNQTGVSFFAEAVDDSAVKKPASVKSPATSRDHDFVPDADGNVVTATVNGFENPDDFVETSSFSYDAAGNVLTATQDIDGTRQRSVATARDARGLPVTITDAANGVTNLSYDVTGALSTRTDPAITTWIAGVRTNDVRPTASYGYNAFGETSHQRDANGALTTITRNVHGDPTVVAGPTYTPPGGTSVTPTTKTDYDSAGLPIKSTDTLDNETTYTYDLYGRPLTQTDPQLADQDAGVTTIGYDRLGRVLSKVDPTGARVETTYDERGLQITSNTVDRTVSPPNFVTKLGYNDEGFNTSVTTPAGNTSTATYLAVGQPRSITDPNGLVTSFDYDASGRTTSVKKPDGVTTNSEFDFAGRLRKTTVAAPEGSPGSPAPRVSTHTYDDNDNLLSTTTPEHRVTGYTYDAGNRLTSIVGHPSATKTTTVNLGYDALGQRTRMVDGNGRPTDTTYNSLGLVESVVEPPTTAFPAAADRSWTTAYDAAGQPVLQTAPGGVTINVGYDPLGNPTSQTGAGAAPTTARTLLWDKASRLVSASSPTGTIEYGYNDRGLLTNSGTPGSAANVANTTTNSATLGYDADGRLSSRVDAAGTTGFTYDKAGQPKTVADPLTGRTLTYSRNPLGQLASVSYGTGASRTFTYNPFGELASDTSKTTANATSAAVNYAYDNDGLLSGKTTTGFAGAAANAYAYDGSARLTSWVAGSTTIGYGWDDADNRTSVSRTVGGQTSTITASFNERNMLLSSSDGTSHTYTPRGTRASTTGATNTTYQTDAFDRMVSSVTTGGGAGTETTNVAYDGLNRAASVNSSPVSYSDPGNTPSALPASGGSTLITRDAAGNPVSDRTSGGANRVLLGDRHTDVTGAVDPATGNLTASTNLDPFGGATTTTGTPSALGFQSGWSADGLLNTASRWYDPDAGAFTSRDTWTLDPTTNSPNRYTYSSDPLDETDPSGHMRLNGDAMGVAGRLTLQGIIQGLKGFGRSAGRSGGRSARGKYEPDWDLFDWQDSSDDWGHGSGYSWDGNPYAPRGGSRYRNSYDNSPGGGGGYSGGNGHSGGHSRPRPLTQAEKNAIQHSRNLHTPIPRSSPKASGNSRPSLVISKKPIVNETGSISNNLSKTTQCDVTCSTQTNPNSTPSSSNPSRQLAEPDAGAGDIRGPTDPTDAPDTDGCTSDDQDDCENVALGYRKEGTKYWAEAKGFTHYLDLGRDEWQGPVLEAIEDPLVKLHINTKGFHGSFEDMVQRGLGRNGYKKPHATEQEMAWIAREVSTGRRSWDSITFYDKAGKPFKPPEPDWTAMNLPAFWSAE